MESSTACVTRRPAGLVRASLSGLSLVGLTSALGLSVNCGGATEGSGRSSLSVQSDGRDSGIGVDASRMRWEGTGGSPDLASGGTGGRSFAGAPAAMGVDASSCRTIVESCSADSECCTGYCTTADGSPLGSRRCQTLGCMHIGEPCTDPSQCCLVGDMVCVGGVCQDLAH